MRIGFIEDTHLRGGTQIWVTEAAKDFIAKGEEAIILAPEGSYVAEKCGEAGAKVYTYDWDEIPDNNDKFRETWTNALRDMDVAICTVHPPRKEFHCSVFAGECIKNAELDTILIPKTGTIVPEYLRKFYVPDDSINVHVISITKFTMRYLINEYKIPENKVSLIYQGTEVDRFTSTKETKTEAYQRYPLTSDAQPVLASAGSFEERKGQIYLLEAVKRLSKTTFPKIHLMLVGEGPDKEMLQNKIREMDLENNVTMFPFTHEPNYIFERIDILTLPSLYKEGLPNVLLEAMSMGLPVIASELAGIPEIIFNGKTGYMIEPRNVNQLTEAIIKLWSDRETYKEMGRNARKLMEEKFDKENQFEEFRQFFHKL
ncbi:glycosyltransferase family 4 protein [Verrucomicrobiota bacterium]